MPKLHVVSRKFLNQNGLRWDSIGSKEPNQDLSQTQGTTTNMKKKENVTAPSVCDGKLHPRPLVQPNQRLKLELAQTTTEVCVRCTKNKASMTTVASTSSSSLRSNSPSRLPLIANGVSVTPESSTPISSSVPSSSIAEKKKNILLFVRVLMKYLEQRDRIMHSRAKAEIKMCYEKSKSGGDPMFESLTTSLEVRLRYTVGERYWKKAHDYLDLLVKQNKGSKKKQRSSSASASRQIE
mmetsp:Transcript_38311/g.80338  ORF Transcript_38311/g.80338 Transcript_38311/m.80338 type:complete len:238 (+) Transcript_38311:168-881(+)